MAWIRVKSTLIKEVTIEEAESFLDDIEVFGALPNIGDALAESVDMEWEEVDVEVLDDNGKEM